MNVAEQCLKIVEELEARGNVTDEDSGICLAAASVITAMALLHGDPVGPRWLERLVKK